MKLLGKFRKALRDTAGGTLECALCRERFEREPPNCPACGSTVFQDRTS